MAGSIGAVRRLWQDAVYQLVVHCSRIEPSSLVDNQSTTARLPPTRHRRSTGSSGRARRSSASPLLERPGPRRRRPVAQVGVARRSACTMMPFNHMRPTSSLRCTVSRSRAWTGGIGEYELDRRDRLDENGRGLADDFDARPWCGWSSTNGHGAVHRCVDVADGGSAAAAHCRSQRRLR